MSSAYMECGCVWRDGVDEPEHRCEWHEEHGDDSETLPRIPSIEAAFPADAHGREGEAT